MVGAVVAVVSLTGGRVVAVSRNTCRRGVGGVEEVLLALKKAPLCRSRFPGSQTMLAASLRASGGASLWRDDGVGLETLIE